MGSPQQSLLAYGASVGDPLFANVQWLTHFENTPTGPSRDVPVVGQTLNFGGSSSGPSSAQAKFGTQSCNISASNGLLTSTTWPAPGSGDWAFEGWYYPRTNASARAIFAMGNLSSETGRFQLSIGNGLPFLYLSAGYGSGSISSATACTLTAWNFIQLIKASGTIKIGLNGVQVGSSLSDSNNFTNTNFYFGKDNYNSDNSGVDGYLDEWRYTVGAARTINLPTAPFPDHA